MYIRINWINISLKLKYCHCTTAAEIYVPDVTVLTHVMPKKVKMCRQKCDPITKNEA